MTITLALDAMGGDFGPAVVVEGAALALAEWNSNRREEVRFVLFGNRAQIDAQLDRFPSVRAVATVEHTDILVTNDMKPIDALRHRADSNLGRAISTVERGEAQAVVSAANTGAYVALAKVMFGTLAQIERPAIPAVMPNMQGRSVVLDLGANLECSASQLTQFALMGEAFARALFKKSSPTVGLLNVGAEEMKGHATVQATNRMLHRIAEKTQHACQADPLKAVEFRFHGFVEGNDIFRGITDVVVTDGFSGNIALKAIEGLITFFFDLLKKGAKQSLWNRWAALMMMPLLKKVKETIDPRLYNGAVFLGLKKLAVKSHGGADAFSFSQAVLVALRMVRANFIEDIAKRLQLLDEIQ